MNDSYPLPNINNFLHNLSKGKICSWLYLKKSYHQISLTKDSKALTAFEAPAGLYEHNVLPAERFYSGFL